MFESTKEIKKVREFQFGILSPDEIRRMSVAHITHTEMYDNGRPKIGGLADPRLGSVDHLPCQTCGGGDLICPGHFGDLELVRPLYHIGFLTTVVKILNCTNEDFIETLKIKKPKNRLREISKLCSNKLICKCKTEIIRDHDLGMRLFGSEDVPEAKEEDGKIVWVRKAGCMNELPKVRRKLLSITGDFPNVKNENSKLRKEGKQTLQPKEVLNILKGISDSDCRAMGLDPEHARPEWMLFTIIPVPPLTIRPSVQADAVRRSEDDLTYKLNEIIKINNILKRQESGGASLHIIQENTQLLQHHIATLITNEIPGVRQAVHRSGRPIKSLSERLKGKEGRIRGHLMGKRCDFSARTVITPDPTIGIDQVGVPRSVCKNLTYPEIVTPLNIQKLEELVFNGPEEIKGANFIIREDGSRIDLRYARNTTDLHLELGYTVERHLEDDDIIVFNRQPSLHKMSMMGHRIVVMPYSTFRVNLSVTTPYNADFDGDEMNLHVPQDALSRSEVYNLMMVPSQIISPQTNGPIIGTVQDSLIGCKLFTKRNTFLEKDQVMNLCMWIEEFDGKIPIPAILKPKPLWTGKQIISMFLPRINMIRFSRTHPDEEKTDISPGDTKVIIDRGNLIAGILDKATLGTSRGSLHHVIVNEHGTMVAKKMLNQIQTVINNWLVGEGYSIGIGDTIADKKTLEEISKTIREHKQQVTELIIKARNGKLDQRTGLTLFESFEDRVNGVLNEAVEKSGKRTRQSLKETNNIKNMVTSGSKGNWINISQIIACVGQQNVEGKRIPYGYKLRTLPHFTKDDLGPESRGFVENSYLRGLTPQEFFFHAMGGREGLVDTAVKTAETGYIQRRLVKSMEDVQVKYDGTVRNSLGEIIQFIYGEDGMDSLQIENQKLDLLEMDNSKIEEIYKFETKQRSFGKGYMLDEVIEDIKTNRSVQDKLQQEFVQLIKDKEHLATKIFTNGDTKVPLPNNIDRLIFNAIKIFEIRGDKPSDLHPTQVIEKIKSLCDTLVIVEGDDIISKEHQVNSTLIYKMLLRMKLSSKRVIQEYKLDSTAFDWVLGEIENNFLQSRVDPGESTGSLAAQSIGEPATQMTLNTFHYAGVSSKNVTLGVPRLIEIINVATNIKTPSLTVFINEYDSDIAKQVQRDLEYTTLKDVSVQTEIYYDPDPLQSCIEEDIEFVRRYYQTEEYRPGQFSSWLLRMELSKAVLADKFLEIEEVGDLIIEEWENQISCICSDQNSEKLILRIRLANSEEDQLMEKSEDGEMFAIANEQSQDKILRQLEGHLLGEIILKGIKGITKVSMNERKKSVYDREVGKFSQVEEFVLDTSGVNLLQVLSHPDVDHVRTMSNDIIETLSVLGIEATRGALLKELRDVISFDGSYVNYRHLATLSDVMCNKGALMAITRHGINRSDAGPLMRSSFEETADILLDAAIFGERDPLYGVSENILLGKIAPIGTGSFGILLDEPMLKHAVEIPMRGKISDQEYFGESYSPSGMTSPNTETPFTNISTPSGFSQTSTPFESAFSPYTESSSFNSNVSFSPNVSGQRQDSYQNFVGSYGKSTPYSPSSPRNSFSPVSPNYSNFQAKNPYQGFNNSSSIGSYSPTSPFGSYSPNSPKNYSPSSPKTYSPSSPKTYSPSSPKTYSPSSPKTYSPSSPKTYSPSSPKTYSPSSPKTYSPSSPKTYSPSSPKTYSPSSPKTYSPSSPKTYSPSSPKTYSPSSPKTYSPSSPKTYSPSSPKTYSPSSPKTYSPSSPKTYSPKTPNSPNLDKKQNKKY
ncbi:DNA-directed RNA polymerase subunit [Anaeramoeba flamelloides]|uniref:DNA-directed RNA polymerase subunit n=1 Tax=Anaeramoeba flamelloides TaxID=1746091 RepID=A0AAV8A6N7_9EUKA|nr:DNA-directed RNA polymerase subunit [Anaeramoeba flamelloides]